MSTCISLLCLFSETFVWSSLSASAGGAPSGSCPGSWPPGQAIHISMISWCNIIHNILPPRPPPGPKTQSPPWPPVETSSAGAGSSWSSWWWCWRSPRSTWRWRWWRRRPSARRSSQAALEGECSATFLRGCRHHSFWNTEISLNNFDIVGLTFTFFRKSKLNEFVFKEPHQYPAKEIPCRQNSKIKSFHK